MGLFAFGLVRWIAPSNTPDVGLFLRTPGLYFRDQLPYLASWTAAIIALSTGLAFFAGRHLPRKRGGLVFASAWWRVFEIADKFKTFKGCKIYVGCELTDGSYVSGRLWSYNATVKETPDRDIVLTACQGPVGSAQWRTVELPVGGQQNCPVVARCSAGGLVGQWRHPSCRRWLG